MLTLLGAGPAGAGAAAPSETTPPTVVTLSPADGATDISVNTALAVTFSEPIQLGATVSIRLYKTSGTVLVREWTAADFLGSLDGADTLTIMLDDPLLESTAYHVRIDSGSVEDLSGNAFTGITDATTWNFTTAAAGGGGGSYSAEAQQYIDRITDPGTTRKDAIAAIIDGIVALPGVWAKIDAAYFRASDIEANALINIKSSSFASSKVGVLAFTADQGFSSDDVGKYIDVGYNASTAGGSYTQNSAHFSVWNRSTTTNDANRAIMGTDASGAAGSSHLFPAHSGTDFYGRINASVDSAAFGTVAGRNGLFSVNRSSATATQGYRQGAAVGSGLTNVSAAPINANFLECKAQGGNTVSDQIAFSLYSGSLTAGEIASIYTVLNTNKWW